VAISNETLKAIIRDYQGLEMTDDELEIMRPELDSYLAEVEKLRELDLSSVLSARLLQAREDG
jgi:Asp-tRNA(Asn)/Glu-tRNA(Gln) amidotransferase C subunit